jgi:GTP-binding protein
MARAGAGARADVRTPRMRRRRDETADLGSPSGIVAIVGRPNVGKSTLFNRLTGERRAIVDELAGLTRDRLYGVVDWGSRRFTLVDTAGLDTRPEADGDAARVLAANTQEGARQAIAEADVICLVTDVRAGITALDEEVASLLRRGGKPVVLVGNKAEAAPERSLAHELYRLHLGEPLLVSALQGLDTGDLCDRLVELLPAPVDAAEADPETLRVAIVGRPNVGKSSLLNGMLGQERALVSPVAGTTRDVVDDVLEHPEGRVRLVDTAGIRRRGVVGSDVEHYSLLRSLRAMERADVAVVVVDAGTGVVAQDRHVAGYAADAGIGVVVVINKWDLLDSDKRADPATLKTVTAAFDFIPGVPVLAVSALSGRGVDRVLEAAWRVAHARATRVPTPALNDLIQRAVDEHPPRYDKGRKLRILYATQAATPGPTFVLFVNDPELMHFSYARYLENRVRAVFGFNGVPLRMVARRRGEGR